MAKSPEDQQKTDAERIGEGGTGKLDDTKRKDAVIPQQSDAKEPEGPPASER
jgi:hypothetical protein